MCCSFCSSGFCIGCRRRACWESLWSHLCKNLPCAKPPRICLRFSRLPFPLPQSICSSWHTFLHLAFISVSLVGRVLLLHFQYSWHLVEPRKQIYSFSISVDFVHRHYRHQWSPFLVQWLLLWLFWTSQLRNNAVLILVVGGKLVVSSSQVTFLAIRRSSPLAHRHRPFRPEATLNWRWRSQSCRQ